jgi:hypothetical protein
MHRAEKAFPTTRHELSSCRTRLIPLPSPDVQCRQPKGTAAAAQDAPHGGRWLPELREHDTKRAWIHLLIA